MSALTLSDLTGRTDLALRLAGCILAGVPTTSLIPLPLTMRLLPRFGREDRLRKLHRMVPWARFCRQHILGVHLDVQGREHLPVPSRGHIYISNHQSWVDILILMEALDTVAFLSKTLVRHIPVIGRCAYAAGSVYVERDDPASRQAALREMLKMCETSTAVVLFPEGTRSPDGELQAKVHPAGLRAAYQHRLTAVPVAVDGTFHVLPKSMDRVNLGQQVAVSIGAPMAPADFKSGKGFVETVWGRVQELFAESRARVVAARAR